MRTGGVPSAALLLVLSTILLQVSAAADIYWEGEEDASNEFLEVKHDDNSLFDRLKRIKRDGWDFFNPFGFNKDDEAVTEADDGSSYGADDMDNYGSGSVDVDRAPDLSEPREKTLRVTFTAIEPYRLEYSNRDSPQFLDFSHSLASAVDALFDKLPGTQKSSLVRIQSLVVDEFSCKVTLDIVTTGFDDTDTIESILRDHIKNNGRLGKSIVTINGFNAQLIDPATEDLGKAAPVENSTEYTYVGENNTYISSQDNGNPDDQDNDYTNPEIFLPENNNVITNTDQSKSEQGPDNSDLDSQQPDVPPYYDPYSQYNSTISDNQENTVDYTPGRGDGGRLGETDVTEEQSTPGVSWYSPEPTQPATNEVDNDSTTRRPISEPNESVCSDDYLRCDQTRCVENFRRCDGVKDCYDETDEAGCPDGIRRSTPTLGSQYTTIVTQRTLNNPQPGNEELSEERPSHKDDNTFCKTKHDSCIAKMLDEQKLLISQLLDDMAMIKDQNARLQIIIEVLLKSNNDILATLSHIVEKFDESKKQITSLEKRSS